MPIELVAKSEFEKVVLGVMKSNPLIMVGGIKEGDELTKTAIINLGLGQPGTDGKGQIRLEIMPIGFPILVKKFEVSLSMNDIIELNLKSSLELDTSKEIEVLIKKQYYKEVTGISL